MFGGDEVITRIEVPVMFDDRDIPAGASKDAQRVVLAMGRARRFLEDLHDDPSDVLPHPLIKDRAQKGAKRLSRYGARAHLAFCCGLLLDQRDKAEVLGSNVLEKAVHLKRILDIPGMHDAENIDRDFVLS